TEAAEEFHEVGIAVRNTKAPKDTDTSICAFFGLVQILVKVIIDVPGTLLRRERVGLDDRAQPLVNRSELLVRKGCTEKLMPGKAEEVGSHPPLAGNYDGVAV